MTSFAQFLREKQFIAYAAAQRIGSDEIDHQTDSLFELRRACGFDERHRVYAFCGSAISVLDEAAVNKALQGLKQADAAQRAPRYPLNVADAILDAHRTPRREKRRGGTSRCGMAEVLWIWSIWGSISRCRRFSSNGRDERFMDLFVVTGTTNGIGAALKAALAGRPNTVLVCLSRAPESTEAPRNVHIDLPMLAK